MKRNDAFMLVLILCIALLANILTAGQKHHGHRYSSSTVKSDLVTSCDDYRITIDDQQPLLGEEEVTVPKSAATPLRVDAPENGGISASGWNGSGYLVKACKAAVRSGGVTAEETLRQIRLHVDGGRVSVTGPDREGWVAHIIIRTPAGAAIDLTSHNGPIGVNGVSGTIAARTVNGPLALKNVSGDVRGETQNGPLDFTGSRGTLRLVAQNGPLNVTLTGTRWEEGALDASTQNGPLSLSLSANYQSGVRVDASEHSPISCHAIQCRQAARTWERPSRIEFGGATPLVRLSTVNGPVSIDAN